MGKPTDFSPWHNDQNVIDMATAAKSDTPEFEKKQFIALIKYMQKYDSIAKLIYPDYTFDYDQIIKYIEDNGVYYIGAVVEGDSKELLKLKNNPYVHCITIDKIVVW
jgi:hypothetical protein